MPWFDCSDCGERLDSANPVVRQFVEVTGWAKVRSKGGANAITMKTETGKSLCGTCMDKRKAHLDGQMELLP